MVNSEIYQDIHVLFRNLAEMQISLSQADTRSAINTHSGLCAGKNEVRLGM
ncbi:Uncharacterised protein [Raoultella terrigena]|nr:Uncharacterised protein [Raoultella terrigena]